MMSKSILLPFLFGILHVDLSAAVSCGGHTADSCAECPQCGDNWCGSSWCNGECKWDSTQSPSCVLDGKTCGNGLVVSSCDDCGSTKTDCTSTECTWMGDFYTGKNVCRDAFSSEVRTASVNLWFEKPITNAAWFMQRIVPKESSDVTYFCGVGFSPKGYGGIQQLTKTPLMGRVVFSVWDQGCDTDNEPNCDPTLQASTVHCGTGVTCQDFGGEGTGRKSSFDTDTLPVIDAEYYQVVYAKDIGNGQAEYSSYFHSVELGWKFLSTIRVHSGTSGWSITGPYAFAEQWSAISTLDTRRAEYGPAWMGTSAGIFSQISKATYSLGLPSENFEHTTAYHNTDGNSIGLSIGGNTQILNPDNTQFTYDTVSKPAVLQSLEAKIPCLESASTTAEIESCLIDDSNSVCPDGSKLDGESCCKSTDCCSEVCSGKGKQKKCVGSSVPAPVSTPVAVPTEELSTAPTIDCKLRRASCSSDSECCSSSCTGTRRRKKCE